MREEEEEKEGEEEEGEGEALGRIVWGQMQIHLYSPAASS